jgi:hypothetical protein
MLTLFKVRTPHPFAADLNMLVPAHSRFADLKTIWLDIAYPPPEHGAGEFSGPEEYEHFPENQ